MLHYFDNKRQDNPYHNIISQFLHQEAIQFRVAENVIDQGRYSLNISTLDNAVKFCAFQNSLSFVIFIFRWKVATATVTHPKLNDTKHL